MNPNVTIALLIGLISCTPKFTEGKRFNSAPNFCVSSVNYDNIIVAELTAIGVDTVPAFDVVGQSPRAYTKFELNIVKSLAGPLRGRQIAHLPFEVDLTKKSFDGLSLADRKYGKVKAYVFVRSIRGAQLMSNEVGVVEDDGTVRFMQARLNSQLAVENILRSEMAKPECAFSNTETQYARNPKVCDAGFVTWPDPLEDGGTKWPLAPCETSRDVWERTISMFDAGVP
jgi:hypothetical protein